MEVSQLREEARSREEPGLNRYNPNSPTALQRKIGTTGLLSFKSLIGLNYC